VKLPLERVNTVCNSVPLDGLTANFPGTGGTFVVIVTAEDAKLDDPTLLYEQLRVNVMVIPVGNSLAPITRLNGATLGPELDTDRALFKTISDSDSEITPELMDHVQTPVCVML
jgi:hypothetical protein